MKIQRKRLWIMVLAALTVGGFLIWHFVLKLPYPLLRIVKGDFYLVENNVEIYDKAIIEAKFKELMHNYNESRREWQWNQPSTWLNPLLRKVRRMDEWIYLDYSPDADFRDMKKALILGANCGWSDFQLKTREGKYVAFFLPGYMSFNHPYYPQTCPLADVLNRSVVVLPHSRVLAPNEQVLISDLAECLNLVSRIKFIMIEIEEPGTFFYSGNIKDW